LSKICQAGAGRRDCLAHPRTGQNSYFALRLRRRRRAANIGGRMVGTSAALVTTQLANGMPGGNASTQLAYAAALVALVVYAGGLIASFSIPWGMAKGDDDLGGYHLVWPRDLVEAAGGLLAETE
jgi:hypothetical protein